MSKNWLVYGGGISLVPERFFKMSKYININMYTFIYIQVYKCVCWSVIQSCPTLCDSMDCSMPGLHIPHHLPRVSQDHVHYISDTIQPSQPLIPFSSSPLNLSQHQGLSQRVGSSSGDQSIGASASASVLPMSIQGWFPLRLTSLISLQSKGLSRVFSSTTVQRHQIFWHSAFFSPALTTIHDHWEDIGMNILTFISRVTSLLFNTLSRFVIAFLPRCNHLLISWLQSPWTVIL